MAYLSYGLSDSDQNLLYIYTIMERSLGYIKDVLACIVFFICFLIVYVSSNIQYLKIWILIGLTLAFIMDGIFSIYPSLHNMSINELR